MTAASALALLAAACWSAPAGQPALTASLDARLELAGVVRLLDAAAPADEGFAAPDIPYIREARRLFAPFSGHAAVRRDSEPPLGALRFFSRGNVLLRLSAYPEMKGLDGVPYAFLREAGGDAPVARWVESLRAFARDSRFERQLERLRPLLEPELKEFRERLEEKRFVSAIEAYCGLPFRGVHRVFLSPFHAPGAVANIVSAQADGGVLVDSIVGPEARESGGISFWSRRVPATLWHELAHGVIDALADLHGARIEESARAYDPELASHCYGDWRQCVKEHAVRAVMLRLLAAAYGEPWSEEQLDWEGRKKYPYLEGMTRLLKDEYEKDRARWPSLADFYPRLLSALPEPRAASRRPISLVELAAADEARARQLLRDMAERVRDPKLAERARQLLASSPAPAGTLPASRANAAPAGKGFPRPAGTLPASRANAAPLREQGIRLFLAGADQEALAAFQQALELDPADAESLASRAVVLQRLGRLKEAELDCARAVELVETERARPAPDFLPDVLSTRAEVRLQAGRRREAAADLRSALERAPSWWKNASSARSRLAELSP